MMPPDTLSSVGRTAGPRFRIHVAFHFARGALAAGLVALGVAAGCGRTGLGLPADPYEGEDAGPEAAPEPAPGEDAAAPQPVGCQPAPESCNGTDDDCDGEVDEDIEPQPCPGGGSRYCVVGAMSACPDRCDTCMPGTVRVCFLSYCKYWGRQGCSSDGQSFGTCREDDPPPACKAIADEQRYSAALEQCCIDAGYCCLDEWDLDHDGDTTDMLGRCDEVACE
jgi:hypothetical protein